LHESTHWGTQALVEHFLHSYRSMGIYTTAKQIMSQCITCQKVNKKVMRMFPSGGQELALRPFQAIQVDFTEFPPIQRWKYLLVIVDHLTHWVEAFPVTQATANSVVKILLEQIIPWFGVVGVINLDFTYWVLQGVMDKLQICWEYHTPWHPQSSGRVERMNQTLKRQITKLMIETKLLWTKCLPLTLLRIITAHRKDIGMSPYDLLFGLPFLDHQVDTPDWEKGDQYVNHYVQTIANNLEQLRRQGLLPQTVQLDFKVHSLKAGDCVLIKT
ncbi:TF28 protein, partial [Grallaria varia]|nr:TF28 protein [Grallaria varia]